MNLTDAEALKLTAPIAGSILIAALGWFVTYFHGRGAATRRADLDRVNDQLRLLYGPLYATLIAGDAAWAAFSKKYWPAHGQSGYFAPEFDLTDVEKARWILWMRDVFHPANERLERIILDHLDLVEGGTAPPVFTETLAHIAVYRAVLRQWENEDFSEYVSVVNFPAAELMQTVEPVYRALLKKQQRLING